MVQLTLKDESPSVVLARVQGATGGLREYLLTPNEGGELMVGHSMWPLRFMGLNPRK